MRFGPKAERAVPELLRLAHDKQFPDREGAVKLLGATAFLMNELINRREAINGTNDDVRKKMATRALKSISPD